MKSMKNFIHPIIQTISRMKQGQLTHDDKVNIIAVSFMLISFAVVLILLVKLWWLFLLLIGAYLYFHKPKQQIKPPTFAADYVIYNCLSQVLHDIHTQIGARRPIDLYDLANNPSIIVKNNVEMVRASVPKSHNSPIPEDELLLYQNRIQARIKADLLQGKVLYVSTPSPDGEIPTIVVDAVKDIGTHLLIDLVLVDSEYKLKYIYWKRQLRHNHKSNSNTPEDKDF